jgi:HK97 family phage portal protein
MSLYAAARRVFTETRSLERPDIPIRDAVAAAFGWGTSDRVAVTARTVAGYPPVSKAIQLIAGDVAKLPLNVYRRVGEDREKASDHPAHKLVNLFGQPNEFTSAFDLWYDLMWDTLLWGKGMVWIERRGPNPIGLYRLLPDRWEPKVFNGRRYFVGEVRDDRNEPQLRSIPDADVLYLPGVRLDGLNPLCPVNQFRDVFSVALSAQRFASTFFDNGAHVGGILQAPPGASEPAIDNVEKAVRSKVNPSNWFKTLVLRDGFRWQQTTVDLDKAQMVELDEAQVRHVSRIFNLPPSKLGLQDSTSYNSLEQENQQYLDHTLSPHLIRLRSQCHMKLLRPSEQSSLFMDFHINSLQWTDASTRAEIAERGIRNGWLTAEEVRRWENMPQNPDLKKKPEPPPADPATDPANSPSNPPNPPTS